MRVELTTSGGIAVFPGLNRPRVVDSKGLAPEAAAELERLVALAKAAPAPPARQNPDAQTHVIRISDDGGTQTLRFSDPIDPAAQNLVKFIRQHALKP